MFKIFKVTKRGATLAKIIITDLVRFKQTKDGPTRGLLPWELPKRCPHKPQQPRQKLVKTYPKGEKEEDCYCGKPRCEKVCPTQEKPKRNAYHVEDIEQPKVRSLLDKTVCEWRRFEKCMKEFCDKAKCLKLMEPDCTKTKKTYPAREIMQKKSVAGCEKPLPKTKEPKE